MDPAATGPIGVFDSGVGGLTILDECMAALPAEDLVYFGDTEFFPYGDRPAGTVRRRALAIGHWLAAQGVKLIVVACNTATAVALADLQRSLEVPVTGVIEPEARAAVRATRNRHVGLMATDATVRSGSYARMLHAHDAGVQLTSVACPGLARLIQSGAAMDEEALRLVRSCTSPLTDAGVDTVILGCTHFPMIGRLLRRALPGATLIDGRPEIAREAADILARRDALRPAGTEGLRRFACSGDPESFRRLGARFLQMPLGPVEVVDTERAG